MRPLIRAELDGCLDAPLARRDGIAKFRRVTRRPDEKWNPGGSPGRDIEHDQRNDLRACEAANYAPGPRIDYHSGDLAVSRDPQHLAAQVAYQQPMMQRLPGSRNRRAVQAYLGLSQPEFLTSKRSSRQRNIGVAAGRVGQAAHRKPHAFPELLMQVPGERYC